MLTAVHVLLTYSCPLKCDHCFVYASPQAAGKVSATKVTHILEQTESIKSIEWIIFEGGEPFLVYPLLLMSVKRARNQGFRVGVITNGYFARSGEAAIRYLRPLVTLGLDRLYISNDRFHYKNIINSPAQRAIDAAVKLGIPTTRISIDKNCSRVQAFSNENGNYFEEIHPLMMVGRAAEKMQSDSPDDDWGNFTRCPLMEQNEFEKIFIDPFGNVQLCHGITIGNLRISQLYDLMNHFDIFSHPIYGPLVRNGPQGLVEVYELTMAQGYQNACHLCYTARQSLVDRFPEYLSPAQIYNFAG